MSKEQERAELHHTIWQIANDLRGMSMAWILSSMCLECFSIALLAKTLPIISMPMNLKKVLIMQNSPIKMLSLVARIR